MKFLYIYISITSCMFIISVYVCFGKEAIPANSCSVDTTIDQTAYINNLVNSSENSVIQIPKGNYFIDSLVIKRNNVIIDGSESTLSLKRGFASKYLLILKGNNITLKNLYLNGIMQSGDEKAGAVKIANNSDIIIDNLHISNFTGKGIDIIYSDNIVVLRCVIKNSFQGIQFWGGDAKKEDVPYLKNITIRDNQVSDISKGGIWGSCGINIKILNNTVNNCNDVGIDFEKCKFSVMANNKVTNCKNACMSFFYGCKDIKAYGNKLIQVAPGAPVVKFFGSSFLHKKINIFNNEISGGHTGVFFDSHSASDIKIVSNKITGKTGIKALNCDSLRIDSNIVSLLQGKIGINNEGGSKWQVTNNTISNVNNLQSNTSSIGIRIYYKTPVFPAKNNMIKNNTVKGFSGSILDDRWGDMSNESGIFFNNNIESFYTNSSRNEKKMNALTSKSFSKQSSKTLKYGNIEFKRLQ